MHAEKNGMQAPSPTYGPLVEICARHGIGRSKAFELARDGLLETFVMGRTRFVWIDSVASLPLRLGVTSRPMAGIR